MAAPPESLTVNFFERKPGPGSFSLERVFADIRAHLPSTIKFKVLRCPHESKGILNRFRKHALGPAKCRAAESYRGGCPLPGSRATRKPNHPDRP